MRHQKAGRKLGRTRSQRKAMYKSMLASIIAHEKIETTTPKAKELRPLAEKLITLGKRGDLHARRQVLSLIPDRKIVHKLFAEIAPRYENRHGGYTRIIRTGFRPGDNAPLSIIEFVTEGAQVKKKKAKKQKAEPKVSPEAKQKKAAAEPEAVAKAEEVAAPEAAEEVAEVKGETAVVEESSEKKD